MKSLRQPHRNPIIDPEDHLINWSLGNVLVSFGCCEKHGEQKKVIEEMVYCFRLPGHSPSLGDVRAETQSRNQRRMVLAGLLSGFWLVVFSYTQAHGGLDSPASTSNQDDLPQTRPQGSKAKPRYRKVWSNNFTFPSEPKPRSGNFAIWVMKHKFKVTEVYRFRVRRKTFRLMMINTLSFWWSDFICSMGSVISTPETY